ncbi:MAG: preprotein translocase subunit SecG [Bacteroidales bacterium]|nr:preprotein translocase subunit SecG [Bacteroidales bacterium]
MSALFITLTVFIVIASLLLVLVVLLQSGKGEGLASNFVAGNQAFGVRQTADFLEKLTWGLVSFILVISIVTSFTTGGNNKPGVDITNEIEAVQENAAPEFPASAMPSTEAPAAEAPATEAPVQE